MGLVARRALLGGEVARPALLDLGAGEPLPLAGVALGEVGVDDDGADADLAADELGRLEGADEGRGHDDVDRPDPCGGVHGLQAAQVGEGGIGVALPAAQGVPLGLAVADEEHLGHGADGTRAL